MSRLVRLYPQAWRDRYEDEFLSLLAERPPTLGDIVDTVRGAVDAHLNPQGNLEPLPWTHRVPGLLALIAGVMWSAVFIGFLFWQERGWDLAILIPLSVLFMFVSLPGDYMAAHARRLAVGIGVVGLCIVVANLPWSYFTAAVAIAGYLIVFGGMLTMAAIRAEIGVRGRWLLLILTIAIPVAISLPAMLGLVKFTEGQTWILLPYGLAWALIGVRLAVRGSPTIVDLPVRPTEPEVRAA
jgi:hypothetical protein